MIETKGRSVLKALSWRFFATIITGAVAYAITEEPMAAVGVAAFDTSIKFFAYFVHERAWNRVDYGRIYPNQRQDYEI